MGACSSANKGAAAPGPVRRTERPERVARKLRTEDAIGHSQFILKNWSPVVSDVYELGEEILGEGQHACVMSGKHKVTGMTRAIKTITGEHDKKVKSLKFEMSLMKRMDHPNIIRLYERFEDQYCVHGLVMEYCEGGTLFDRAAQAGHLTETDAASVARDMLRAVFYLHQREIVHRDLKPENFMLRTPGLIADNVLKLIDFGTARRATETTILSTKIGTAFYVAPEVGKGRYCRKCDVWSCGAVTYTLLCGSQPFSGDSDVEILEKVDRGVLTFEEPAWKGVSDKAKTCIRQLMCMSVRRRCDAERALSHEWIADYAPKGPDYAVHGKHNFVDLCRSYRHASKLKRAVLLIIAHQVADQMGSAEMRRLHNNFMALDADGNGQLSREEVRQGLLNAGLVSCNEELEAIMDAVDIDDSGSIDYTEFLAVGIYGSNIVDEAACRAAFNLLDRDGDGQISTDELAEVLDKGKLRYATAIAMHKADGNGDGMITFDELLQMMEVGDSTRASPRVSTRVPTPQSELDLNVADGFESDEDDAEPLSSMVSPKGGDGPSPGVSPQGQLRRSASGPVTVVSLVMAL